MAVNYGTVKSSNYDGRYIQLDWNVVTQGYKTDGTAYSTIKWTLTGQGKGSVSYYQSGNFLVQVSSSKTGYNAVLYETGPEDRITLYEGTSIASGTFEYLHNAKGEGDLTFDIYGAIYTTSRNVGGDGSFTLPAAPGAADMIMASVLYVNANEYPITFTNWRRDCTYTLRYSCYKLIDQVIAENITDTGYRWRVPTDLYTQLTHVASRGGTIICETFYNGYKIGVTTREVTFAVAESYNLPTITDIDLVANYTNLTGSSDILILNLADVNYTVTAEATNGAVISATNIVNKGTINYGPTGTIQKPTSATFTATVTDSRGFTSSKSVNMTTVDYKPMTCNLDITDPSATGEVSFTISGNFWSGNFGAVENTLYLECLLGTDAVPVTPEIDTVNHTYSFSGTVNVSYTETHTLTVMYHDSTKSAYSTINKKFGVKPVFDWGKSDFNFNVPVTMQGDLTVKGNLNVEGAGLPQVMTWNPHVYLGTTQNNSGIAVRIGDVCIVSFFVEAKMDNNTTKVQIYGLPFKPDATTRWWAGGGNAANYLLYTEDTAFNGWCIEETNLSQTYPYCICGRAGGVRNSAVDTTTVTKESAYIGAKAGDTFYASGTIMYKVAAGE